MYLKRVCKDMEFKWNSYMNACDGFKDALNEQFYSYTDWGIVEDVIWQPSDGFVIVWDGNNSVFDIDEIEKIYTRKDFEEYLDRNKI